MINHEVGTPLSDGGRSHVVTHAGTMGHAIYGEYDTLAPGAYVVEFTMKALDRPAEGAGQRCAIIEVVYDQGHHSVARRSIDFAELDGGDETRFAVPFAVSATGHYECRVWVSGAVGLDIDDYRPITAIPPDAEDVEQLVKARRFPSEEGRTVPFFRENEAMFRNLYEQGCGVQIVDGRPVLTTQGMSLFAGSPEETLFVGEVLQEGAYNFSVGRPACAIDIGMNVGLTSLSFATREDIVEIHAFEPFPDTYAKAAANLSLNPGIAGKITAHAFGLSDHDHDGEITINPLADIGAKSTVGYEGGVAIDLKLRDAATVLQPIIADARARGLSVVVKVDCEGSEFAIFASLDRAGLLPQIDAFMVEWHAMFAGKSQEDLIAPLRRNGFIVFDRSPPRGNGFFYAARLAAK